MGKPSSIVLNTSHSQEINIPSTTPEITKLAQNLTNVIHLEEVKALVNKFKEQDELLRKAKEFSQLRAKYATLEAATYAQLERKGWGGEIGHPNSVLRKATRWIASLSNSEYDKTLDEILNSRHGETLVDIWRIKHMQKSVGQYTGEMLKIKTTALDDFDRDGYVSLSLDEDLYYRSLQDESLLYEPALPHLKTVAGIRDSKVEQDTKDIQKAIRDNTRISLRKRGAVGVGGGKYVDPDRNPELLDEAIAIRKKNITYCINRLYEIYRAVHKDALSELVSELQNAVTATGLPLHITLVNSKEVA